MLTYSAVGTPDEVRAYVAKFVEHARADELIVIHPAQTLEGRLRSMDLLSGGARVKSNEASALDSQLA
jgi:alkanesulfonate monooxygenase SsuD/methylene tetrahydromethanopterin reductase-like flavin-dependent oxidoreductase (luciferase family)